MAITGDNVNILAHQFSFIKRKESWKRRIVMLEIIRQDFITVIKPRQGINQFERGPHLCSPECTFSPWSVTHWNPVVVAACCSAGEGVYLDFSK